MDTDVSDLCCVNSRCPEYGKRGAGNLVCRKLHGKERRRFVRCRTCRAEFSERRGTALFGVTTPTDKALSVLEHVADGCGVRQTARLTGVTTDTVNIAFVERYNGTDRHLSSRKARKLYRFSKDPGLHEAMTHYAQTVQNFCRPNRALRVRQADGSWQARCPAMAEGLNDQVWSIGQLACRQAAPPLERV